LRFTICCFQHSF